MAGGTRCPFSSSLIENVMTICFFSFFQAALAVCCQPIFLSASRMLLAYLSIPLQSSHPCRLVVYLEFSATKQCLHAFVHNEWDKWLTIQNVLYQFFFSFFFGSFEQAEITRSSGYFRFKDRANYSQNDLCQSKALGQIILFLGYQDPFYFPLITNHFPFGQRSIANLVVTNVHCTRTGWYQ